MSDAWGTPMDHEKTVAARRAAELGGNIPTETKTAEGSTEETFKVEVPTVVLPDGSKVKVDEYDPYAKERENLIKEQENIIAEKGRIDGVLSLLPKQGQEDPDEKEPEPLFKPIEFNEEEQVVGETDKILATGLNGLGEVISEIKTGNTEEMREIKETVNKLANVVSNRFLEDELNTISARTGFTKEELIAANEESGIDNPALVATYLKGKKAEEEAARAAEEEAAKERIRQASGITGTTSGGGTGTGDPNERPKIDYTKPEEVAKHFNFAPVD